MTSADRTFRAFLDVLGATLDEPDLSGADLAARLHLSRFHADRLVAAAAGEPPGALRRRILLERAAYRLATAAESVRVVDLAHEAGFDTHDGFTRAFTRAFGAPPSVWRRVPRSHLLPAPSKVHFQPPGSLRLPSDRRITAMDLVTRMTEHHVWLVGEMLERAGRLDADVLDRPVTLSVGRSARGTVSTRRSSTRRASRRRCSPTAA
ncbi:helix-turn-helix domain-containing protein [Kineosporia sp. R_H_3]|uniref:helix-turn-helix domain-containing protein n=1 Tax=Kineosporia sp. R_H_3 TaxID=1961848 RepID=UPI0013045B65|nr:AraC family transcriptional regulator [Kineosporia sp. R_H_3]